MPAELELENMSLDNKLIGKRIKSARNMKKYTQEDLAGICHCSPTHICKLENGKIGVSLALLFRISIALDKNMDFFLMDNSQVNPQVKINEEIAPKLVQCDSQMLDMVNELLDRLLKYREMMMKSSQK